MAGYGAAVQGSLHPRRLPRRFAFVVAACLAPVACRSTPSSEVDAATAAARAETIARIQPGSVRVGDRLPDVSFESLDGPPVALSSLRGRPAVLVFGSCTCGPFVESMGAIAGLERQFRGRVAFILVYVDEAHPTDGWVMPDNAFVVARARSIEDRRIAALEFRRRLGVSFPIVLETMDRAAERTFGAFPNRMVIADADGVVVATGKPGPYSTTQGAAAAAGVLRSLCAMTGAPVPFDVGSVATDHVSGTWDGAQ